MPNSTRRRSFESVRRPQLVDEVIGQLRERFASGDFEVGDTIPSESALIAELGVGRTTLREAIRVLEYAGILEVRRGSGTFVRSLSGNDSFATRLRQARREWTSAASCWRKKWSTNSCPKSSNGLRHGPALKWWRSGPGA